MNLAKRWRTAIVAGLVLACLQPKIAWASGDSLYSAGAGQAADSLEWMADVTTNGEDEIYLRYLQIAGAVPLYPWSVRGLSTHEAKRLTAKIGSHPWSRTAPFRVKGRYVRLLPASAELRANSAFPFGSNDGPVWAGRGITASATVGAAFAAGPFSLVLAPTAFITQNASFDLLDNGHAGRLRFADGLQAATVDRPQRFGEEAYGRVDPGNSTLRADIGPLTTGISTANMAWGPMELYPYVLGTNAPGFLHGFAGTSHPINLWVGSLHGRVVWGRLEQSEYSPVEGTATYTSISESGTRRFASGLVMLFNPRGVAGLELGVARFFHSPWPSSGIPPSYFRRPFEAVLKRGIKGSPEFADPGTTADNQLISGFARWAFPGAGFEMYAEYGREDHSWDKRDFVQEPDHSRSYGLGFRKTMRLRPGRMEGLTLELINFQEPHLARTGRGEGSVYVHGVMRQGHTHRGQLLGADVGVAAAAGGTVRWDMYGPRGHTALSVHRTLRQQRGSFMSAGPGNDRNSDVQYGVEAVRTRRGRYIETTTGLGLTQNLNRNFGGDATNVSAFVRARVPLRR